MDKVAFVDGVTEKQLTFSEVELKLCAWTAMVYGYYYT